jgi:hypothetical protein
MRLADIPFIVRRRGEPLPRVSSVTNEEKDRVRGYDLLAWKNFDIYDSDVAQKRQAQEDLILGLRKIVFGPEKEKR